MSLVKKRPTIFRVTVKARDDKGRVISMIMDIRIAAIQAMMPPLEALDLGMGVALMNGKDINISTGYGNLYAAWRSWVEDQDSMNFNLN